MTGGKLTTHVLDTARGLPAAGMRIELWHLAPEGRRQIGSAVTNADGRSDAPMLAGAAFRPGRYELVFFAGEWLRRAGLAAEEPLFLDEIPIRFGIADASRHFHVPLLVSPFAYSTYRGS